jgi:serpin B
MNRHKFNALQGHFLQRRYGVSLGRRYVLTAASIMMLSVLGYSPVDNNIALISKSSLANTEPQPARESDYL